jgi:uridine kinase
MDHPDTLDHELYARHLQALRRGEKVDVPVYDFKTHTRSERVERVSPKPFVIAEGILVLHYPDVRALCDYSIFLDVPDSERLSRRIARDVRERGRTEASVLDQWHSNVQPMHETYCAPTKAYASEIITGVLDDSGMNALWLRIAR